MEENAYLTAVLGGCFYLVAGVRLMRLGLRTRERPELMLAASVEAKLAHRGARKRVRVGLCDPIVANRYLLLAWFGFFQTLACVAGLYWAYDREMNQGVTRLADALLGGSDIACVVVLWFAFFPPSFYRNWITTRAEILPSTVGR